MTLSVTWSKRPTISSASRSTRWASAAHLSVELALGVSLFVQLLGQPLQGRLRLARPVDQLLDASAELGHGLAPLLRGLRQVFEPRSQRRELVPQSGDVLVGCTGGLPGLLGARGRVGTGLPHLHGRLAGGRRRARERVGDDSQPGQSASGRLRLRRLEARGLVLQRIPEPEPRQLALRDQDLSELAAAELLFLERVFELPARDEASLDEDLSDRALRRRRIVATPFVEHPRELANRGVRFAVLLRPERLDLGPLRRERTLEVGARHPELRHQDFAQARAGRLLLLQGELELGLGDQPLVDDERPDQARRDCRRIHTFRIGNPSSEL